MAYAYVATHEVIKNWNGYVPGLNSVSGSCCFLFTEDYDPELNRTRLSCQLVVYSNKTWEYSRGWHGAVHFGGKTIPYTDAGGASLPGSGGGYVGGSASLFIDHDADGDPVGSPVSVSFSGGESYGYYYLHDTFGFVEEGVYIGFSASGAGATIAIASHARGSTIASCPASVETQDSLTLTVNRNAAAYRHKASFKIGSTLLAESDAFAGTLSYPVPRSWFANAPNDDSLTLSVEVQTYTDESCTAAVGEAASASVTVTADAGMKPGLSAGWAAAAAYNTGAVAGMTGYIKGYSRAEISFDTSRITNAAGASTASFSVSCQGETVSASPYRTPLLASVSVPVVCTVTDSRGRSASETITLSVMDYARPSLTQPEIVRCRQDGTADEEGTYYAAGATLSFSSLNAQNSCTLKAAVAAAGGSYGTENSLTSGVRSVFGTLSPDVSYTVRISAEDSLGNSAVFYQTIPTRKWAMKFRPGGRGVAFGKAAETDDCLEIAPGWTIRGQGFFNALYPVGSVYVSDSAADPAGAFGGTWSLLTDSFVPGSGLSLHVWKRTA